MSRFFKFPTVAALLLGAALAAAGCSSGAGSSGSTGSGGTTLATGTVEVHLTDPTHHYTPGDLQQVLRFTGYDSEGNVSYGPLDLQFNDIQVLTEVPVQAITLEAEDPDDPTVFAEAPMQVDAGGLTYVTDMILRPRRLGLASLIPAKGDAQAAAAGDPVQLGAGYIQTKRPAVGSAGGNAVMAGSRAFAVTSSLPFPYKTNSWLTPILAADNYEKTYLGPDSYNNKQPRTILQLPVFPHPWAAWYNVNGQGHQGLLLTPERVRATAGANVPAPSGPGQNSTDQMAELQTTFDVASMKVDPGFQPYAIKVHRMGDYDAELIMRGLDDRNFDKTGLPKDAALKLAFVRGSPFVYFRAVGLPKVTLYNFFAGAVTNTSGTVNVGGLDINYTVITGPYGDGRTLSTVLFYPAASAAYTPSPVIDSVLTFNDPQVHNYFVLCALPDDTFGDTATLTKLAEAAFSYPVDSTVTYAYDQATQASTATYHLDTVNVLVPNGPTQSISGLMPHHYETLSWHTNEAVLQAGPAPLQNGAAQPMEFLTVRGMLKVYDSDTFVCRYPYPGVLPWLPPLDAGDAAGRAELHKWIYDAFVAQRGGENPPYTAYKAGVGQDAYNLMKFLGRNVLAASSIADVEGDAALAGTIMDNTREAIEVYFRQTPTLVQETNQGQAPYYVYYDPLVGTLNQYPSVAAAPGNPNFPSDTPEPPYDGFGTLARCNDHHFHYGYMINAAAVAALRDPAWAAQWKDAINQVVFDVANDPNINTSPVFKFPKYRSWDAYMNHGMAAGFNWDVVIGNNEESVSEHINFWNGVILWAAATGQQDLMNQAIAHYSAIVHSSWVYWFDPNGRNQQIIAQVNPGLAINWPGNGGVRIFDAYTRWDTFFGIHPAAGRGIMMFPLTPGAFYHAMGVNYINQVMADYDAFVGAGGHNIDPLNPDGLADWRTTANPWLPFMNFYSIFTKYAAMGDPQNALTRYYPVPADYNVVNGIIPWDKLTDPGDSGVFVYHWVRYMQTHGRPDPWVKATNTPFFMTFHDTVNNKRTYAAYNATGSALTVNFSDGESLANVPAHSMGTKTVTLP